MNELNTRLLEYLPDPNTVKGGLGSVVESLQAEAPQLVSEIIRWHIFKGALPCVVVILCLILIWSCVFKSRKWIWDKQGGHYADEGRYMPVMIASVIATVFASICLSFCFGWVMPLLAPRLFLLEYVRNLF